MPSNANDIMTAMLGEVDNQIKELVGTKGAREISARADVAQVYATCALVHAVRELTEIIKLKR